MAKCLRCGAGNEWIQGSVRNEPRGIKPFVEPWTDTSVMIDGNYKNGRAKKVPIRIIRERDYQRLLRILKREGLP